MMMIHQLGTDGEENFPLLFPLPLILPPLFACRKLSRPPHPPLFRLGSEEAVAVAGSAALFFPLSRMPPSSGCGSSPPLPT